MTPTVKFDDGEKPATHMHRTYGACVIGNRLGGKALIHTNIGSALVSFNDIHPIKESK